MQDSAGSDGPVLGTSGSAPPAFSSLHPAMVEQQPVPSAHQPASEPQQPMQMPEDISMGTYPSLTMGNWSSNQRPKHTASPTSAVCVSLPSQDAAKDLHQVAPGVVPAGNHSRDPLQEAPADAPYAAEMSPPVGVGTHSIRESPDEPPAAAGLIQAASPRISPTQQNGGGHASGSPDDEQLAPTASVGAQSVLQDALEHPLGLPADLAPAALVGTHSGLQAPAGYLLPADLAHTASVGTHFGLQAAAGQPLPAELAPTTSMGTHSGLQAAAGPPTSEEHDAASESISKEHPDADVMRQDPQPRLTHLTTSISRAVDACLGNEPIQGVSESTGRKNKFPSANSPHTRQSGREDAAGSNISAAHPLINEEEATEEATEVADEAGFHPELGTHTGLEALDSPNASSPTSSVLLGLDEAQAGRSHASNKGATDSFAD